MILNSLKNLIGLALFGIVGVGVFANPVHAKTAETSYLMWQMPTNVVSFPVYVYQGDTQTAYLYSPTQQDFIGEYDPSSTTASYDLYFQDTSDNWFGCSVVLTNGKIDTSTTCAGTVISAPAKSSNVYTVGPGATAWPAATTPPNKHKAVNYSGRKITFVNNTDHEKIRIGQHCTKSANPNNLNCTNNQNLFEISRNGTAEFYVDGNGSIPSTSSLPGLISNGFTLTAYQHKKGDEWVKTGGYDAGQQPFATKIEFTHLKVDTKTVNSKKVQIPTGSTNFDISAVDGYNIAVAGYPDKPTYCTYTVPPENSNVLGAGKYSKKNLLAAIAGSETICNKSSQLPKGYSGTNHTPWDLVVKSDEQYEGCRSPCSYAIKTGDADADKFCCTGKYNSPSSCDQSKGTIGANNSTYVTNLKSPISKHVYRFAYDDAIGDFACPAETSFVIIFGIQDD